MRGATRDSFIVTRAACDLVAHFVFFELFWLSNVIFGVNTTGWQSLGLLWVVSQTLFLAMFNIIIKVNNAFVALRFIFLFAQMLILSFAGSFLNNYIETEDG